MYTLFHPAVIQFLRLSLSVVERSCPLEHRRLSDQLFSGSSCLWRHDPQENFSCFSFLSDGLGVHTITLIGLRQPESPLFS